MPINEGLFRRQVLRESGKDTLDALGLEGGWRCLMDGGKLDTGEAKGAEQRAGSRWASCGGIGCAWTNSTTFSKGSNAVVCNVKSFISHCGQKRVVKLS